MAVKINFNEAAAQTHTSLVRNERAMTKSLLRLSTGVRILNAADDSAGLFIADMLGTVAKAYDQGNRNIQTGISALQIAEASTGQIFDKLQEIYVRAQNAANDINDPTARAALQQEIRNFVDAIQKIGTDTEYNGIKLLDGTFKDKFIHYGARMEQTIYISINDVRAQTLGAHLINTNGYKESGTDITAFTAIAFTDAQTVTIGDRVIKASSGSYTSIGGGTFYLLDAGVIANEVNSQLADIGFKAKAVNVSVGKEYTAIADVSGTADLTFYVGEKTVSITGLDTTVSLDTLIEKINRAAATAGADLSASRSGNRLVLTSSQGYTIGLEVQINPDNTSVIDAKINIDQLINDLDNKSKGTVTATTTGLKAAAAKVGDLYISRDTTFNASFLKGLGDHLIGSTSSQVINLVNNPIIVGSGTDITSLSGIYSASAQSMTMTNNGIQYVFDASYQYTINSTTFNLYDVGRIADKVNQDLGEIGYSATATNSSTASTTYSAIATGFPGSATVTADLTFFVGGKTVSVTGLAADVSLDDLVDAINNAATAAGADLTAANNSGKLVLTSSHGYTIGLAVSVTSSDTSTSATINFDQLLEGASAVTKSDTDNPFDSITGYAARVGSLKIDYESGGASSQFKNLYSVDVTTNEGAEVGMLIAETAQRTVDKIRAQIGATMNNLQSIFDSQKVAYDNTKEAESVIRNTDYAKEMSEFTTYQIRMQATIAMLAQANTLPQLVLQLLR